MQGSPQLHEGLSGVRAGLAGRCSSPTHGRRKRRHRDWRGGAAAHPWPNAMGRHTKGRTAGWAMEGLLAEASMRDVVKGQ